MLLSWQLQVLVQNKSTRRVRTFIANTVSDSVWKDLRNLGFGWWSILDLKENKSLHVIHYRQLTVHKAGAIVVFFIFNSILTNCGEVIKKIEDIYICSVLNSGHVTY